MSETLWTSHYVKTSLFVSPIYMQNLFIELHISQYIAIIAGIIYRPNTPPKTDMDKCSAALLYTNNTVNQDHTKITCKWLQYRSTKIRNSR